LHDFEFFHHEFEEATNCSVVYSTGKTNRLLLTHGDGGKLETLTIMIVLKGSKREKGKRNYLTLTGCCELLAA